MDIKSIEVSGLSIDNLTSVLVVTEDLGNGKFFSHLPHTDKDNYRIYLTECLEE